VNKNNKKWRNAGLYALLLIVVLALASAFLDRQPQSREVLTYSDFIHQVESNKIDRVNLSADRTQAQVPNPSGGQPFLVNLPNDPDLINILTKNGVDIAVTKFNAAGSTLAGSTFFGGNGTDGCSIAGVIPLNTAINNTRYTCTFGPVSSSSTGTNEIYVRIRLTSGQSVTALSLQSASN
jgi:hypothetical protein